MSLAIEVSSYILRDAVAKTIAPVFSSIPSCNGFDLLKLPICLVNVSISCLVVTGNLSSTRYILFLLLSSALLEHHNYIDLITYLRNVDLGILNIFNILPTETPSFLISFNAVSIVPGAYFNRLSF